MHGIPAQQTSLIDSSLASCKYRWHDSDRKEESKQSLFIADAVAGAVTYLVTDQIIFMKISAATMIKLTSVESSVVVVYQSTDCDLRVKFY